LIAIARPKTSTAYTSRDAILSAVQADVKARSAYGDNPERLVEVKTMYCPKNLPRQRHQ
jgi:hypothetical protein